MGFEYRIRTNLSEADRKEVLYLIEEKQYNHINKSDGWPDMFIEVIEQGIYVCQNRISDVWQGLEELKIFLETKGVKYTIEEI